MRRFFNIKIIIVRMKKIFLFLCIISSFLISCNNPNASEQTVETTGEASQFQSVAHGAVVHVDLDSLTENFLMTKDLMGELETKMNRYETELGNRQRTFQQAVADLNNRANRGLETRARLQEMSEKLAQDEQNLMQLAERYRMEIAEEQMVMQRQILQAIMDYLEEYNREKGYKYILGNAFGSIILFADPSLNITDEVLEGLNAKYRAGQR